VATQAAFLSSADDPGHSQASAVRKPDKTIETFRQGKIDFDCKRMVLKGANRMTTTEIVNVVKDLITSSATIGSAICIVITYLRHQREAQEERSAQAERDNKARAFEARKPFNDKQLAVYSDVAGVAGKLATITDLSLSNVSMSFSGPSFRWLRMSL
jgi:hypothetical protein